MYFSGVLLWCIGLKILYCHCNSLGRCHGTGSSPSWGTSLAWELPYAVGAAKKNKKNPSIVLCLLQGTVQTNSEMHMEEEKLKK